MKVIGKILKILGILLLSLVLLLAAADAAMDIRSADKGGEEITTWDAAPSRPWTVREGPGSSRAGRGYA